MKAVWRAARFAVRRRRLQTSVIALVLLLSTATVVLAMGLLVTVEGPFDKAFAQQRGAHLTVSYDPARTTAAQVAASASRPGVTAAGGPYATQVMNVPETPEFSPLPPGPVTVVARTSRDGDPVDRPALSRGRWATAPGEIVLAVGGVRVPFDLIGRKVTFSDGRAFTVVGTARSVTRTAQAWVAPGQLTAPDGLQMLYRLADPDAPDTTVTAGLPVTSAQSYTVARDKATEDGKVAIPFLVAFGIAGLVVAVLIIANVVSGAVVSGFRHIGVLKALGFTPAQVTGVYLVMVAVPGVLGGLIGVVLGNVLAGVVITAVTESLDLPAASGISVTVDVLALLGVLAVVVVTALIPAVRAGRIPAAVAVSAGTVPRRGRALRVQRALAGTRLPRTVSLGLGLPFARPGRTALTVSAVAFGVAAATFSAGIDRTMSTYFADAELTETVHVLVPVLDGGVGPGTLTGRPGTAKVAVSRFEHVHVPGFDRAVHMRAYQGPVTDRHGHRLVHGRWMTAPGEAVVGDSFLKNSGKKVGDTIVATRNGAKVTLRIVGTALVDGGDSVLVDWASLTTLGGDTAHPAPRTPGGPVRTTTFMEVTLTPGTSPQDYVAALRKDGVDAEAAAEGIETTRLVLLGLITLLTLGLVTVAGLGVFNTVVLNTQDRARDFGVLKSLGATPRQVMAVVLASMAALGLLGGLVGLPLGMAAHHVVMPAMAGTGGLVLPYGLTEIFPWPLMLLSVLAGVAIALLGALIPAGRAARIKTAAALRSE